MFFLSNGFIPTITKPTRITHTTAALIDNIYISAKSKDISSGILNFDISDHLPIFMFANSKQKNEPKRTFISKKNRQRNTCVANALFHVYVCLGIILCL